MRIMDAEAHRLHVMGNRGLQQTPPNQARCHPSSATSPEHDTTIAQELATVVLSSAGGPPPPPTSSPKYTQARGGSRAAGLH
jgi:hypothetical protein